MDPANVLSTFRAGGGAMRLVRLETLPKKPRTEAAGALSVLAAPSEAGAARGREGELAADEVADGTLPSTALCGLGSPAWPISSALLTLLCRAACEIVVLSRSLKTFRRKNEIEGGQGQRSFLLSSEL